MWSHTPCAAPWTASRRCRWARRSSGCASRASGSTRSGEGEKNLRREKLMHQSNFKDIWKTRISPSLSECISPPFKCQCHLQGSAVRWSLGCVNPASWPPLAAGSEFIQPRAYLLADSYICIIPLLRCINSIDFIDDEKTGILMTEMQEQRPLTILQPHLC